MHPRAPRSAPRPIDQQPLSHALQGGVSALLAARGHVECTTCGMTTKPTTYIVCDHCGSAQTLTPEWNQGIDPDGRSHRAMDIPCSACGRPGAMSASDPAGTEALRRITERENGLAS